MFGRWQYFVGGGTLLGGIGIAPLIALGGMHGQGVSRADAALFVLYMLIAITAAHGSMFVAERVVGPVEPDQDLGKHFLRVGIVFAAISAVVIAWARLFSSLG